MNNSDLNLSRRTLTAIFAVAVVLRLINIATIEDAAIYALIDDSPIYWKGAEYWLDAGFFARPDEAGYVSETERVPLYFLFLIPFRWLFGDVVIPVLIAQALVDAGTCIVIARIGAMIDRLTGIVAGLFAALSLNLIIHSSLILTDTLFVFLFSLILLFSAKFLGRGRLGDVGFAALICGLAIMTRPVAIFLPAAMAITVSFIINYRDEGWRRATAAVLIVLVLATIPVLPILHRNLTQFGTAQLTSQTGQHMLAWVVGYSKALASGRKFDAISVELNAKFDERIMRLEAPGKKLTSFESSHHRMALARKELRDIPVATLLYGWTYGAINSLAAPVLALEPRIRALNKASFYNARGDDIVERSRDFVSSNDLRYVVWLGIGVFFGTIALVLQALGWVLLIRRMFWPTVFGSLAILYFLLINGPVGGPKYRLPFEPILIIFQSVAVIKIVAWWRDGVAAGRSGRGGYTPGD